VDVKAVQHVALSVDDLDAALRFYALLGFDPISRPDFGFPGAWLQTGDAQIHLIEVTDPAPHDSNHVALWVDDVDAAVEHLRSHGLKVSSPSPVGDGRQSFLKDPAGNLIELNEPGEPGDPEGQ
jgi:catechol 2,3-dioxygenase-like lactoylglutathione lyase family enzyme